VLPLRNAEALAEESQMHIFIDESGSFQFPSAGNRNLSCVGALVVPEGAYAGLTIAFNECAKGWPGYPREFKGSQLIESQIAAVIEMLIGHGCLLFVKATEMSLNSKEHIEQYRSTWARYLSEGLTSSHPIERHHEVADLRATLEGLSLPLLVQAILLTNVVRRVIDESSVYFSVRVPSELAAFRWVIDAKDTKRTHYELAWQVLAVGQIQGQNIDRPGIAIEEGDYSHFNQSFGVSESEWPAHLPKPVQRRPGGRCMRWNLGKVLFQSMRFEDSAGSPGLQLVDVVSNCFRRALMGRLKVSGYARLGELMIRLGPPGIELYLFNERHRRSVRTFREYDGPVEILNRRVRFAGC